MLETLLGLLKKPQTYQTPLPEADARHAMGALMVRAAKADNVFRLEEIQAIDKVLAERYGLNPIEAAKMRAACQNLEREMPDTDEMTAVLRDAISVEEKEATLTALWRVVYADGIKQDEEDVLLHEIEELLGIPADRAKELQLGAQG